jgi:assimilatory nitrate reductase catalytic subunit
LVEIHPDTAISFGLAEGGLARVSTAHGSSIFRVNVTAAQRPRELFVPIHWTDQTSGGGRAGMLPGKDRDPVSGQPGFKNTPATVAPYKPEWTGFLIGRERPTAPDCAYWTVIRTAHGWLTELAGRGDTADLRSLLPAGERAEMVDARRGVIRSAVLHDGQLEAALFVTRGPGLPSRDWLATQLGEATTPVTELLAGRPASPAPDRGPIICVCFDVGLNTIIAAIAERTLLSVEAVGGAINAGTNCGSCRPAIAKLFPNTEIIHV